MDGLVLAGADPTKCVNVRLFKVDTGALVLSFQGVSRRLRPEDQIYISFTLPIMFYGAYLRSSVALVCT
jgi:hypothetical protein